MRESRPKQPKMKKADYDGQPKMKKADLEPDSWENVDVAID